MTGSEGHFATAAFLQGARSPRARLADGMASQKLGTMIAFQYLQRSI
jgi:hypothetical protein